MTLDAHSLEIVCNVLKDPKKRLALASLLASMLPHDELEHLYASIGRVLNEMPHGWTEPRAAED